MVFGFGRKATSSKINPTEAVRRRENIDLLKAKVKKIRDDRQERDTERKLGKTLRREKYKPVSNALSRLSNKSKAARSGRGGLTSSESPFKVGGSGGSPWKIGSSGSGFPSAAASNPWNLQSSSSPFTSGGKEPAKKKKRTIRVTIDD